MEFHFDPSEIASVMRKTAGHTFVLLGDQLGIFGSLEELLLCNGIVTESDKDDL